MESMKALKKPILKSMIRQILSTVRACLDRNSVNFKISLTVQTWIWLLSARVAKLQTQLKLEMPATMPFFNKLKGSNNEQLCSKIRSQINSLLISKRQRTRKKFSNVLSMPATTTRISAVTKDAMSSQMKPFRRRPHSHSDQEFRR